MRCLRLFSLLIVALQASCSVREFALRSVGDAFSATGTGYGKYADLHFVESAAAFGLTTSDTLAESLPKHLGIRLTLASGFTQYGYAFIQQEAERLFEKDVEAANEEFKRAKYFYLMARGHALDALEIKYPGIKNTLLGSDQGAWRKKLEETRKGDVPFLYWTAASWALSVSNSKDDPSLIGDLPLINQIMKRALFLDEKFDDGAIHEFFITFEVSIAQGDEKSDALSRARWHKDRALLLSQGTSLGALVSYAETVLVEACRVVPQQIQMIKGAEDRQVAIDKWNAQLHQEFVSVLEQVIHADIQKEDPRWKRKRLANVIAQNRAKWLLKTRQQELFTD